MSVHADFSVCMQQLCVCLSAVHRLSSSERVIEISQVTVGCLLVLRMPSKHDTLSILALPYSLKLQSSNMS